MTVLELPRDPSAPEVAVMLADNYRMVVIQNVLEVMRNKKYPDYAAFMADYVDAMEELQNDQTFLAQVDAETAAYTAKMEDANGRSVEYQSVQIAASDRWQFHPEHPKTVTDLLQSALQGTAHGSGTFYRIRWLAGTFVPYCLANGVNAVEHLYDENARTKAQYMAERLMSNFKADGVYAKPGSDGLTQDEAAAASLSGDTKAKMDAMLECVNDPEKTVADMKEQFPVTQSRIPTMQVWHYVTDDADYYVTKCVSRTQSALYERLLNGKMDIHLGTGDENFIALFSPRK